MSQFISYKDFLWEYEEFGHGPKLLLAFHGFDRPASDFKVFEQSLGGAFKIISINLFYHGNSSRPPYPQLFTTSDLKGLIEAILEKMKAGSFSLMGYSLGGKIALACVELFPGSIENLYLFAPDGILIKNYYLFLSTTKLGHLFVHLALKHPGSIIKLLNAFLKLGWLSEKIHKFALHHVEDKVRMRKVANIWMIFRKIVPNIPEIQKIINTYHINTLLFFGAHDAIIPSKLGLMFAKDLEQQNCFQLLEMGHNLITEKTNRILAGLIH
jgi:pimeloyl-ACP methyl ester carboxylesterase